MKIQLLYFLQYSCQMSFEAQENKTKNTNSQNLYEKKYKFNILGITFGFRDGTSVKAFAPIKFWISS